MSVKRLLRTAAMDIALPAGGIGTKNRSPLKCIIAVDSKNTISWQLKVVPHV
ncbi:hypothetical protein [Pseudomonas sp. CT11-2]|jgi:hypothetical protein|uniref:hypothetical protein n=1 Tax=Pseudomonas sp. CT11-2 TaxID=3243023 RepID=UPI0039B03DDF